MRWLGAVLVAFVLTQGTASAAPELAGVTTVRVDAPAYMDVVVPKPLHFFGGDPDSHPRAVLEGEGTAIILSLRRLGTAPEEEGGRDYVQFDRLGPPDNRTEGASGGFSCDDDCEDDDFEPTTKPGRYRLYLLSDRPATATIRLPELEGTADLRPSRPAAFEMRPMGVFETSWPDTSAVGAWGNQTADGGQMGYLAWFDSAPSSTLDRSEWCFLESGETSSGSEFGPGCSGAAPDPVFDFQPLGDGSYGLHATYSGFPAGRYGLGMNLTHVGGATPGGGVAYWAGFNDDEPLLPDSPPAVAAPATGRLSLTSARVGVRRGRASVRLGCSTAGPCEGALGLVGARRLVEVALPAGSRATVRLAVPARLRKALRRHSRATARLVLRNRTATGLTETVLRVRLVRRR